ncbi:hypothetical protein [Luteitalea sp.]|uniref:hypothetical protein n=1 Tax=Luteitalea sp. TaxID=2004800 RepID=UPI0037C57887
MPLIRLARDKRGIDTLYLLHQRPDGRGEPRLRVLYFCAMPQGQSFGRGPLDPATQRALEQRYPDIPFDWTALLKEVEQRRLPPPMEPQARRGRPPGKAERRPPASEVQAEKPAGTGKRKRRRGGPTGAQERASGNDREAASAAPAPIIE